MKSEKVFCSQESNMGACTRIAKKEEVFRVAKEGTWQRKMASFNVYCVLYTLLFRRVLSHSSEVTVVSQTGENYSTVNKVSSESIRTLLKRVVKQTRIVNN